MSDFKLKSGAVYGVSCYDTDCGHLKGEHVMRIRKAKVVFDEMSYDHASWCAVYLNNVNHAVVEITHGVDKFSRAAYNGLIQSMFIDACGGWESRNLVTYVFNRSGKLFCQIRMVIFHDGSEIWVKVYVNGEWVRDMFIAQ